MKFVIDMCLPEAWVPVLSTAGYEVIHWLSVGSPHATDREIMEWARANGRVVFTHDLDFSAILAASGADGPSVLQLREQDVDPARRGNQVLRALADCAELLEQGAIVTIDLRRFRARALPLPRRAE